MRSVWIVLQLAGIVVGVGCNPDGPAGEKPARTATPGARPDPAKLQVLPPGVYEQTVRLEAASSKLLRYAISIPAGYSDKEKVPLILALHYAGEMKPFFGKEILTGLVGPALRELGAVIVAPDAMYGDWTSPDNDRAVCSLLDRVAASYAIDTSKIAVTGYSIGGIGAWHFAGAHPERFVAAIPMAGAPTETASWRTPVYAIHSRSDAVISLEPTQRQIERLQAEGVNAHLVVLEKLPHDQADRFVSPLRDATTWLKGVWSGGR